LEKNEAAILLKLKSCKSAPSKNEATSTPQIKPVTKNHRNGDSSSTKCQILGGPNPLRLEVEMAQCVGKFRVKTARNGYGHGMRIWTSNPWHSTTGPRNICTSLNSPKSINLAV
jgi:hypothetical protein